MRYARGWAAALGAVAAMTAVRAEEPARAATAYSAADFAQLPSAEGPAISPDGTHVAARMAVDGQQYFAVMPLVEGGKRRMIGVGDMDLNWWRWVGDKWLVIGIGQVQKVLGEEFYVRRAMAVEIDTGKIKPVSPRDSAQLADDILWASDDGNPRVLLSMQTSVFASDPGFWPEVREIELATGHSRKVQRPLVGVAGWYADGAGTVRMGLAYGDDSRSIKVHYRDAPGAGLRTIAKTRKREEGLMIPALVPPEQGKALVIDDDEGGYSALYDLDLATMTRGKQLAASKGFDIAGLKTDPSGTHLWGVSVNEDRPATRWTDPDLKQLAEEVAGLVKNGNAEVTSVSRDRQKAIFVVGSAAAPGATMVYDRATKETRVFAFTNDTFQMKRLHPVRTIRYKARDGLEIAAVLTLPKRGGANFPLILLPHGGPFARDTEEWDWWTQFLADRGYAVVQPNYRGSSGYGTPFTQRGEGQWGLAMQDDLNDAVRALADQGIVDPKRVCIVGASYGGYAAERAAERDSGMFRCAVSYAGVSDLKAMLRYDSRFLYAGARGDWMRKQAPDLAGVSPINAVARFSTPLLLVHGAKDRVVPVAQSRNLAQKLKAAGKAVTYIEQPKGDHHFTRMEDRLTFLQALEAFLKEHNPA